MLWNMKLPSVLPLQQTTSDQAINPSFACLFLSSRRGRFRTSRALIVCPVPRGSENRFKIQSEPGSLFLVPPLLGRIYAFRLCIFLCVSPSPSTSPVLFRADPHVVSCWEGPWARKAFPALLLEDTTHESTNNPNLRCARHALTRSEKQDRAVKYKQSEPSVHTRPRVGSAGAFEPITQIAARVQQENSSPENS